MVIKWIRLENDGKTARSVCGIDENVLTEDGMRTEEKEVFFSVASEYADYLVTERCDAYVVVLIRYALEKGYNIRSLVPMSEDLCYNITEHLLPPMVKNGRYNVRLEVETAPPLPGGSAVGTGASCGVDSLHAIRKYKDYPVANYRITHLCMYDVGAFNGIYDLTGPEEAKEKIYARSRVVAAELGLPLIETGSNIYGCFKLNYLYSHDFYSAFAIFCLKKLWKHYYYASEGVDYVSGFSLKDYLHNDSAAYETLLFDCLSTSTLRIYSEGSTLTRFEKIDNISDYPVARKHLFSCTYSGDNCSKCDKCTRNILALDTLGKLDDFSEVYDVEFYRAHKYRYMWYLHSRSTNHYFEPIFKAFKEKDDEEFQRIGELARRVKKFDALWERNDRAADKKAVELLQPYELSDVHVALRMAKAYALGRGVEADNDKKCECLRYAADYFRKEIEDGFDSSRIRLFDVLWDLNDPDCNEEMFAIIIPMLEDKKPKACVRMARMCKEGRIVDQDIDAAVDWMRDAVGSNPGGYLVEYCELLLSTDSEENHREAMRLCTERYELIKNSVYCALISRMYRDGKGAERSLDKAISWMAEAYGRDPDRYYVEYCKLLLRSGNDKNYEEAMNVCLKRYSDKGHAEACEFISGMYRDGKGVKRDLDASVMWMKRAMEKNRFKYVHRYCYLLISTDELKYHLEAMDICKEYLANGGSPAFCAIIARMYRFGKGVEENHEAAAEWMVKAVDWKPAQYLKEYLEIVLDDEVEKYYSDAMSRCMERYEITGAPGYAKFIADMHRDGKGTPKNLDSAAEWIAKSIFTTPLGNVLAYCSYMSELGGEYPSLAVRTCEEHYSSTKSPAICIALSHMYRGGEGIPKDMRKSVEWMRKAFESDPEQYLQGYCRLLLETDEAEFHKEAMDICVKAYESSGSAFAAKAVSDMYRDGKGVDPDSKKALEWMRLAVGKDKGYMDDYCGLLMSIGDEESYKEAMDRCLELYDETGSPAYAELMSMLYRDGEGVQDMDKALEWMRKASDADSKGYTADLCKLLLESGREECYEEAFRICSERYESSGDLSLCIFTARMYRDGKGVERDMDKAIEWMRKAADWNPRAHMMEFARLLLSVGGKENCKEAMDRCLVRYANSYNPVYAKLIADMHRYGKGTPRNVSAAIYWMRNAVMRDPASYTADYCDLLLSTDDPKNHAEAMKAATDCLSREDVPELYIHLGRMYRDGKGVERDMDKAIEWMRKAADWNPETFVREFSELLLSTGRGQDAEEAMRRCKERYEESGSPLYAKIIAGMYRDGKGAPKDMDKAVRWIRKVADADEVEGKAAYYEFLVSTDVPEYHAEAMRECMKQHEAGGPPVYCALISRMYRDGKGVKKSIDKAIEWMERAYMEDPKAWYSEFNALLSMNQ
ncbi:MAG: sel1 repeat family protein [Candidatus Methanomethylophilaceae archaeon]|nr:sel1 repeat family protein [Candidatus Methanomethylophilaceae archaeon]